MDTLMELLTLRQHVRKFYSAFCQELLRPRVHLRSARQRQPQLESNPILYVPGRATRLSRSTHSGQADVHSPAPLIALASIVFK